MCAYCDDVHIHTLGRYRVQQLSLAAARIAFSPENVEILKRATSRIPNWAEMSGVQVGDVSVDTSTKRAKRSGVTIINRKEWRLHRGVG